MSERKHYVVEMIEAMVLEIRWFLGYPVIQLPSTPPKGSDQYPALAYLLGSWFHQDYDLDGTTLEELMPHYIRSVHQEEQERLGSEIDDFLLRHGLSTDEIRRCVDDIFDSQIILDDWDGMTNRQWLEKVRDLVR